MKQTMRFPTLMLLLALLCVIAAGCGGGIRGGQAGSCGAAGPRIEASPAKAAPSDTFRLRGTDFANYSSSSSASQQECPRPLPVEGIRIEFVQGSRTWTLATVTSPEDLRVDAEVLTVPADAAPGEAVVRATSPQVSPPASPSPPQADTPFLVLGALPDTGGPKHSPTGTTE